MFERINLIKYVIILTFLLLIISNIELQIVKSNAIYSGRLVKDYIILKPSETKLNEPVYIYNTKRVKADEIISKESFTKSHYVKERMTEHIASKLNKPLRNLGNSIKSVSKTNMPVNSLFKIASKSETMISAIDPSGFLDCKYKIMYSPDDNIEAFVSGDEFYIVKNN